MLIGFKRRFALFVEEGSKTHTIRAKRKIRPRVGETCHCYVDPRQKSMRLLGRFPCVKVEDIFIDTRPTNNDGIYVDIRINGMPLSWDEKEALARRDGFRGEYPLVEMMRFWEGRLPFVGDLIHWKFEA